MIYSFIGYIVEVINVSIISKKLVLNRGFLIGPYCPIYGWGALAITILLKRYMEDPLVLFVMSTLICSIIEYLTSYFMEKKYHARWWDYSNKKFNINGRICLETLIPFGILGVAIMYGTNPILFKLYNQIPQLIINILIVWALTGIWHGASWNFVIWGLYFGIILLIEKLFLKKYLEKLPGFIQRIYVLFIVMISFIIFNANNMKEAWSNIIGLFGVNGEKLINKFTIYYLKNYFVVIIIAIIASTPIIKNLIKKLKQNKKINKIINILEPILIVFILIIITSYAVDNSYNPFLYFRF